MKLTISPDIIDASPFKKLELVDKLLSSIGDMDLTTEFKKELNKRAAEIESNPSIGRSWAKVRAGKRKK